MTIVAPAVWDAPWLWASVAVVAAATGLALLGQGPLYEANWLPVLVPAMDLLVVMLLLSVGFGQLDTSMTATADRALGGTEQVGILFAAILLLVAPVARRGHCGHGGHQQPPSTSSCEPHTRRRRLQPAARDSPVPARVLHRLTGMRQRPGGRQPVPVTLAMH